MVKTPLFPDYHRTVALLKLMDGKSVEDFKQLWNTIWQLTGTPQDPVDWQNPDEWIPSRLSARNQELATEIWSKSEGLVNPRHMRGIMFFINNYNLIDQKTGTYKSSTRTKDFISKEDNHVLREIDISEGCLFLLGQVSINKSGKRSTFFSAWKEYLESNSNYRKVSVINDSMRRRLRNLTERKHVNRDGNNYIITEKGEQYLNSFAQESSLSVSEGLNLSKEIEKYNTSQKQKLKEYLQTMDPFLFEHVIKDLLSAMDYEDVTVTSPTNDKGVDVTGISQNGITTVKEVIQIKRIASNIQRNILDQLRGSLHRFNAFQGTIITISDFGKGAKAAAFETGAAPITLINGDKLVDLLVQNQIGIVPQTQTIYNFSQDYFDNLEDTVE